MYNYLNEHFRYHNTNIDPNFELHHSKMSASPLVLNHCAVCTERKYSVGGECFRTSGPLICVLCILHINACGCGVG